MIRRNVAALLSAQPARDFCKPELGPEAGRFRNSIQPANQSSSNDQRGQVIQIDELNAQCCTQQENRDNDDDGG